MTSPISRLKNVLPELVLVVILLLTINRIEPPPLAVLWEWCFLCGESWATDALLNIALFVPLGFALRLSGAPWFRSVAAMLLATTAIEVTQLVIPMRITSIDDVLSNTAGGILGYWLGRFGWEIFAPRRRAAMASTAMAGAAVLIVLGGSLWLFGPAPTGNPYWGQFAPVLGQFDTFGGNVIAADVGGLPLRNGRLPNTEAVRAQLERDSVTVRAVAAGRRRTRMLAPVVSIFDSEHHEVMLLGRIRYDLVFRLRRRSTVLGFRTPEVTVWNAFPTARPGTIEEPVRLSGTIDRYTISATAKTDTSCVTRSIQFRHTNGWAYLVPFENLYTDRAARFTTLWLALIFAPLGYYSAVAVRRFGNLAGAAMSIGWILVVSWFGLMAIPRLAGIGTATAGEWIGAALGVAAGVVLGATAVAGEHSRRAASG